MKMNSEHFLYQVSDLPVLQNRVFESSSEARDCEVGDVELVQNLATGFIYNKLFDPCKLKYDENYQNEQANSRHFQDHLDTVAQKIQQHFPFREMIEVGCGKGNFMERLRKLGYQVVGVDPTYEGSDPAVYKQFYEPGIDLKADGIVLRHVLEHIQDPFSFLETIRSTNDGRGRIYIEVPCFEWICKNRTWFDVFYEHVNYFRLVDFHRMFGNVIEAGHTFGGQYLYAIAELASLKRPENHESGLDFPTDFSASLTEYSDSLQSAGKMHPNRKIVVWGAASKGVIFSLFMQRLGVVIDAIVDINPSKQGKFAPVTGIAIISPQQFLDDFPKDTEVIVMNRNYLTEIKSITKSQFNYRVPDEFPT